MPQRFAMTPRQRYLENRQRKQNLTFSLTASIMAVLVIVSLFVLLGIVKMPFSDSFSQAIHYAGAGDVPCPSTPGTAVAPKEITVQVLNATSQQGLATEATTMLKKAGFKTADPANSTSEYPGAVEIDVGANGVDKAYTVSRLFPESRIVLTDATDTTVTVILGSFYDGRLSDDDAAKALAESSRLTPQSGCLALDPSLGQSSQSGAQSGSQSGSESGTQSGR